MVKITPLPGKYYTTELSGDGYYIQINYFEYPFVPSERELEEGWGPEDGSDHVEHQKAYELAQKIEKFLNGNKG